MVSCVELSKSESQGRKYELTAYDEDWVTEWLDFRVFQDFL